MASQCATRNLTLMTTWTSNSDSSHKKWRRWRRKTATRSTNGSRVTTPWRKSMNLSLGWTRTRARRRKPSTRSASKNDQHDQKSPSKPSYKIKQSFKFSCFCFPPSASLFFICKRQLSSGYLPTTRVTVFSFLICMNPSLFFFAFPPLLSIGFPANWALHQHSRRTF